MKFKTFLEDNNTISCVLQYVNSNSFREPFIKSLNKMVEISPINHVVNSIRNNLLPRLKAVNANTLPEVVNLLKTLANDCSVFYQKWGKTGGYDADKDAKMFNQFRQFYYELSAIARAKSIPVLLAKVTKFANNYGDMTLHDCLFPNRSGKVDWRPTETTPEDYYA